MHARLVRRSRWAVSLPGRDRVTRIIIGVLVVLVVGGFPTGTLGEPDWELPTDPIANCIADCAETYPHLGEDYEACVEDCNTGGGSG